MTRRPPLSVVLAALLALALALGACGSDEPDTASASDEPAGAEAASDPADGETTDEPADAEAGDDDAADADGGAEDAEAAGEGTYPVTVATAAGDVTIEARPERIVSMSSTATEILFAIGAGDQVAAVDSFSNYPPEAPITDLSAFEPNLEAVAGYDPDLVVLGFGNEELEAGLADIGVPVLVQPPAAALDDTYDQVAQLGEATGQIDGAVAVNGEIRSGIETVLAEVPETDETVRVYHELDDTFFSASSGSFIGQLYELLGFENVADAADPDGSNPFPQLQVDQILASDPNLIVYTDAYTYDAEDIAARPGWDSLSAVTDGNIVEVDDDVASRWGPRVVDFLQVIVDSVAVPTG